MGWSGYLVLGIYNSMIAVRVYIQPAWFHCVQLYLLRIRCYGVDRIRHTEQGNKTITKLSCLTKDDGSQ